MNKPRLYLDFGKGYEKDKADTFTKIINRLEEVYNDVDKYMVIQEINNTDETFTYLETQSVNDADMKPDIIGYNSDSRNISIRDAANNDLLKELSSFNENGVYPLIVNQVVAYKYKYQVGDTIDFYINNTKDRLDQKLLNSLNNLSNTQKIYKFKIVGINNTYINEEWITLQSIANSILGLDANEYNGIISNNEAP